MRPPARSLLLAVLAAVCLTVGVLPGTSPTQAADPLPQILLDTDPLYSGPVVGYHYTAKPDYDTGSWPAGSTLRYQWFRGDKQASPDSFVPVPGATSARYTMSAADHWHRMKARVQAWRDGRVVGEKFSGATNFILYQMKEPVVTGQAIVGQSMRATLGPWTSDWTVWEVWRRSMKPIAGVGGLTYLVRPADVGKSISVLVMATHQFPEPNPTKAIDRRWSALKVNGAYPPVRWATRSAVSGVSRAPGQLRVSAITRAWANHFTPPRAAQMRGQVRIYDGARLVKTVRLDKGKRLVTLTGLRRGAHQIRVTFVQNSTYAGSTTVRTLTVR